MLYIAIEDPDFIYRNGMEIFLSELFLDEQDEPVQFNSLTKINATQVDVIVKNFVAGEEYICQPILKFRSKPGLIIGIVDGDKKPYHDELPLCIQNIVFINRSEKLDATRNNVIHAWKESVQNPKSSPCKKCLQCKYRTLTPQQETIAKHMLRGKDIVEIAQIIGINVKTVSAHKRLMMSKFNLNSDCELLQFLSNLKSHNPPVHLFNQQD